jgi:hypothetical protein
LATAAPADRSELIEVGVGVGGGAVCAWTVEAVATAVTKASAAEITSLRRVLVSFARESRDEPYINAISKKTPARQKMQNPIGLVADLRPVLRNRQSALVLRKGRIADIVVAVPQVVGGDLIPASIS